MSFFKFGKLNRKVGWIAVLAIALGGCKYLKNQESNIAGSVNVPASIVIKEDIHNFGELQSGEIVSYVFKYKNTSDVKLRIDSVDTGTRKVNVKWYPVFVSPGKEGNIEVSYNSSGDWGDQTRPIILYTNTKEKKQHLVITAKVNNENIN